MSAPILTDQPPLHLRLWRRLRRADLSERAVLALVIASVAAAIATYAALTDSFAGADTAWVQWLLGLDGVLLLALGALIAPRVAAVWLARRRSRAGARLLARVALVFGLLAIVPAALMAILASVFFFFGIDAWFDRTVRTAIEESHKVASAYVDEHEEAIRLDVERMADDLGHHVSRFGLSGFERAFEEQAKTRELSEVVIVETGGGLPRTVARYPQSTFLEMRLDPLLLEQARTASGPVLDPAGLRAGSVQAVTRIPPFDKTFLIAARWISPDVVSYQETVASAYDRYRALEAQRGDLQLTITLIFLLVTLLLLAAAIWTGLVFAGQLVGPVGALVGAAERVRDGDLSARVVVASAEDELAVLGRAFNQMAEQLGHQREALIEANGQLDRRRQFIETVLTGVSAGVIGLDPQGRITLANRTALALLEEPGGEPERLIGEALAGPLPEVAALLGEGPRRDGRRIEAQVQLRRDPAPLRTLHVRLDRLGEDDGPLGWVVTFDDVSELLNAQRMAAWADVARRIAHEIKNPLTPIQLSAERLKRKYLKQIGSDPETFVGCTDTIVRHVGDIRRMVDEFSMFARMPRPVFRAEEIGRLCDQALFLQRQAHGRIRFELTRPAEPVEALVDGRQLTQVLTNLLQNAVDAIEGRTEPGPAGWIGLRLGLEADGMVVRIEVADNGRGLPAQDRERLTEPYVTTRAKGTGLGLAIVKKILEDHGGALDLADRPGGGAVVSVVFPRRGIPATGEAAA